MYKNVNLSSITCSIEESFSLDLGSINFQRMCKGLQPFTQAYWDKFLLLVSVWAIKRASKILSFAYAH